PARRPKTLREGPDRRHAAFQGTLRPLRPALPPRGEVAGDVGRIRASDGGLGRRLTAWIPRPHDVGERCRAKRGGEGDFLSPRLLQLYGPGAPREMNPM